MTKHVPLWFKIAYTAMVTVIVVFYIDYYGMVNFLWFSNVALLTTVITVWLELRLLATMQLIAVGVLEIFWAVDFLGGLALAGEAPFGLAGYMFDENIPLHLRLLSLYHLLLPWILLWLTWRLGYDERGWWAQTLFGWCILLLTYFFTDPHQNINWVFGIDRPQDAIPPGLYLLAAMIIYPLVIYLPSHFFLRWLLKPKEG